MNGVKTLRKPMDFHSSVRWTASAQYFSEAVNFVTSMAVARVLQPDDYGLMGMAVVFVGLLGLWQSLGFSVAIVQRKDYSEAFLHSVFFLNLAMGLMIAGLMGFGSPLIAAMFGDERIGPLVAVLGIAFVFTTPGLVPSSILRRDMEFDRLAMTGMASTMTTAIVAVVMAYTGFGVWSLVASSIAGQLVHTVMLYAVSDWRPRMVFRWSEVRPVIGFGLNFTGNLTIQHFAKESDKFIIGRFLGTSLLGYYSLAYRILSFPRKAIFQIVGTVLVTKLSRLQNNDAELKDVYLRISGAIAFATFPLMLGIMCIATPFVTVVLGAKWLPSVPLILILAPIGMLQSVEVTTNQLFVAKGRADWMFRWSLVHAALTVASFLAGLPWGLHGMAISYSVVSVILFFGVYSIVFRLVDGLSIGDLMKTLLPHFASATAMAVIVTTFRMTLEWNGASPLLVLVATVPVGILSYWGIILCFRPLCLDDYLRLLPRFNQRSQ